MNLLMDSLTARADNSTRPPAQSVAAAGSAHAADDQPFIDAVSLDEA